MASYTFAEAAELTGLSKKALRNRVYRGQLEAALEGGVRRIPRAELERSGLLGARPTPSPEETVPPMVPVGQDTAAVLIDRLERQAVALARLERVSRENEELRSAKRRLRADLERALRRVQELEEELSAAAEPPAGARANRGLFKRPRRSGSP